MVRLSRSVLVFVLILGSSLAAQAGSPKDFYCKTAPDADPVYVSDAVRACPAAPGGPVKAGESEGACIYQRVGCMLIDDVVDDAARKHYPGSKGFDDLPDDQKAKLVQLVTPYDWINTETSALTYLTGVQKQTAELELKVKDARAKPGKTADEIKDLDTQSAALEDLRTVVRKLLTNPEIDRRTQLSDVKSAADADSLAKVKVSMFASTLICRAPGEIDNPVGVPVRCPPPEDCKEDAFYNPVAATVAFRDLSQTPVNSKIPVPVFRIKNKGSKKSGKAN
jgi:hypothetical protein